jgi:hypothetical protein
METKSINLNISDEPVDLAVDNTILSLETIYNSNNLVTITNPNPNKKKYPLNTTSPSPPPLPNKMMVINGWSPKNQTYFRYCLYRLKYYRIINNFFFFDLKKREGRLSWYIIVLSSVSSVLSLINTQQELFMYSTSLVKWFLVLITVTITLISAYIKKQHFIDRINNIDRYLQQLNQLVEELNVTFILEPEKRENYDEFCKKYIPMIKNLSVSPASFSPNEWKKIVYTITNYYPELIRGDGSNSELLWPWYYMDEKEQVDKITENKRRSPSEFGKNVISSYNYLQSNKRGYSCFNMFGCCKPKFILEHEQHIGIHTDEHKA